ncbi:MAG: phosphomannomutase/phosphoglucomutase [Alphaproteobacteria bacterium]|nr:phosphomannomutase/phosphoglucomutase [Alphaproteobacteria bacterium]
MLSKPQADLKPNTEEFENTPLVKPTGFREYDARWLFPDEINLSGMQALGFGLGNVLFDLLGDTEQPRIVVGHDFRAYSQSIKIALTTGLMSAGVKVLDIGLALSPTAYFAQFHLDAPAVAMVTASHNENGWTGVKMGAARPLTFGPDEMSALRDMVLENKGIARDGGAYERVESVAQAYKDDLNGRDKIKRPLKAVVACGNGTAGAFAPQVLRALGVDVVELHCELDHSFPHHNPNPEDMEMLHAMRDKVLETGADIGFAFDGDGDRCGVVDNEGEELFADKMGVLVGRDLAKQHKDAVFVADVKSTGLFNTDPELQAAGATTHYWKTGHSYMKRHTHEIGALAGFEKSGHYFFNAPIGRGYDDGIVTAIAICDMLARADDKSMADLRRSLPVTYGSPTMSPYCDDLEKYDVVDRAIAHFEDLAANGGTLIGQKIRDLVTVNGVRITVEDGTWGLVRASSNKPGLVVVVESPTSEDNMRAIFAEIDGLLSSYKEVGEYDQKI